MLNQFVIVGRLVNSPELRKVEKGNVTEITLAVPRSYKNKDGEYETDFIDFIVYNGIAENTKEYCKKGDIVGVKGRIQTTIYEQENEKIIVQNYSRRKQVWQRQDLITDFLLS